MSALADTPVKKEVIMGNKILLRQMYGNANVLMTGGVDLTENLGADVFTAEEDLILIGALLVCHMGADYPASNAGSGEILTELSTYGSSRRHDGVILETKGNWVSNGAAHLGFDGSSQIVVMFPAGKGVSIKEEGEIYLHTYINAYSGQVGVTVSMDSTGLLYLVRGVIS